MAEERFVGHRVSHILAGRDKFFWSGLACIGILFWYKCLGPMYAFDKDDTTREIPVLEFIKQRDPFIRLRTGSWGQTLDLSI